MHAAAEPLPPGGADVGVAERLANFVEILRWRADHQGATVAFRFLQYGGDETRAMTYAALDGEVRSLAARIQAAGLGGERVLLLYASGPEYLIAVLACLYAGAVAVPLCAPQANRSIARLETVALNCQPRAALTTGRLRQATGSVLERLSSTTGMQVFETDSLDSLPRTAWRAPAIHSGSIACLQYTSGSTVDPRGVVVTHGNLLHNCRMIGALVSGSPRQVAVSWLPFFHDMGLVGSVFLPLYLGCPLIFMPPEAFVMKPVRWLEAIARYGATLTTAPNFAYDLCVRRTTPAQRAGLALSTWKFAFNGAERIHAHSLRDFTAAFEGCGFRPESFLPCYGLAEATLFVTGGQAQERPIVQRYRRENLDAGEARPDDTGVALVSSGRPRAGQDVIIVDPKTCRRCPAGRLGEVWVSGPSVAAGYWNNPDLTIATFEAFEAETRKGPYLRTGDIAFQQEGELFVTGRLKDLIIIGGRNIHPDDVEATVEAAHPAICARGAFAFAIDDGPHERLIVVAEVDRRARRNVESGQIERAVRDAVAEHDNVAVSELLLVEPHVLPKTASGKKQRAACRAAFLQGVYNVSNTNGTGPGEPPHPNESTGREEVFT